MTSEELNTVMHALMNARRSAQAAAGSFSAAYNEAYSAISVSTPAGIRDARKLLEEAAYEARHSAGHLDTLRDALKE